MISVSCPKRALVWFIFGSLNVQEAAQYGHLFFEGGEALFGGGFGRFSEDAIALLIVSVPLQNPATTLALRAILIGEVFGILHLFGSRVYLRFVVLPSVALCSLAHWQIAAETARR